MPEHPTSLDATPTGPTSTGPTSTGPNSTAATSPAPTSTGAEPSQPAAPGQPESPDPPDLSPGAVFPDLRLTDHAGNDRSLSELVAGDPTVLHFYRGWWCPKEQRFFDVLRGLQAESEVAYTRIVSVSVDPPPVAAAFRAGLGARWTFLSDPERVEQRRLALRETTDTLNHPYVPRVFTLAPDRSIHTVYDGYWYWGRPRGDELRSDLREISRRVRPEWEAPTA